MAAMMPTIDGSPRATQQRVDDGGHEDGDENSDDVHALSSRLPAEDRPASGGIPGTSSITPRSRYGWFGQLRR